MSPNFASKGVRLLTNLKGTPLLCSLDPRAIRRAVQNIIVNALKYTGEGDEVEVAVTESDQEAAVVVSDSGPGIPTHDLENIFERFYRADQSRSRKTGGTGLGLTIAREVVQAHGGRIEVESELGKDNTFTVVLPRTAS